MKKKLNINKIWVSALIITSFAIAHLTVKNEILKLDGKINVVESEIISIADKNKKLTKRIRDKYGKDYIVLKAQEQLNMRKMNKSELVKYIGIK